MITYRQLKSGYILKVGDELLLHGVHYQVRSNASDWYYLENKNLGGNHAVFVNLGINGELMYKWAAIYGGNCTGVFPNIPSLEQLSNFVVSIYEHHKYKIGDMVVIRERKDDAGDYPYYFDDDMANLAGNIYKVTEAYICPQHEMDESESLPHFDGDIYQYRLSEGDGKADDYMGHSSMLCPFHSFHVEESDILQDEPDSQEHIFYEQEQASPDSIIVTLPKKKIDTTIKL